MDKKRNVFSRGLTLIEVLVAATALGITLTAMVSLIGGSLSSTIFSQQQSTANQYVQEALETARALRDTQGWQVFNSDYGDGDIYCLDSEGSLTSTTESDCSDCTPLVGTVFRHCLLFENDGDNRKKITAKVSWNDQGKDHLVETTTYLTNWQ